MNVSDLDPSEKYLILRRSCLSEVSPETIYLHHKKILLDKYSFLQKNCCDPYKFHPQTKRTKSLRVISTETAEELEQKTGQKIKPGQKWCSTCTQKHNVVQNDMEVPEEYSLEMVGDIEEKHTYRLLVSPKEENINRNLTEGGFSPLKANKVSRRDVSRYGKRKCLEAQFAVSSQVASCLDVKLQQKK